MLEYCACRKPSWATEVAFDFPAFSSADACCTAWATCPFSVWSWFCR